MGTTPLYLDVPYSHREVAKRAGAWWDPARRRWYLPPGRPVNFYEIEDDWIPMPTSAPERGVAVTVLGLPVTCWRCAQVTTAIIGLDPGRGDGFATTESGLNLRIALHLLGGSAPDDVGAVKIRRSRTAGESYLSNGCRSCDALLGKFPLSEAVTAVVAHDRRGIVVLGRGKLHPLLLDAASCRGWVGG